MPVAAQVHGHGRVYDDRDFLARKKYGVGINASFVGDYLLKRKEACGGLAILTTNMKSNIDGAIPRCLDFIVNFPFHGVAVCKRM